MLRLIIFSYLLIGIVEQRNLFAQPYHDNIWIFSDLNGASIADFSSGEARIDSVDTDLMMAGASAIICDTAGNLAFYTNGCRVYNWQHMLMENGEGINAGDIYDDFCNPFAEYPRGYPGVPQGTTIIPWPDRTGKYILLHILSEYNRTTDIPIVALENKLMTSIIDMKLNNGEGKVIEKNIAVDTVLREPKMVLNRHANGVDWWLVNPLFNSNDFAVYLIDSSGVNFHQRQSIGLVDSFFNLAADQLVFTPRGDQLLRFSVQQGLRLFDFDRFTGELSNFHHVPFPQGMPRTQRVGSVAVSPSGQYAYVNNTQEVYQYDLWAEDIGASQLLIAEMIDDGEMVLPPTVQIMQLGPDCKIYAYMVNGNRHHIIHNPDERGEDCGWEQGGLLLGRYVFRDQPTFPNFRLGPVGDEGSPCAEPIVSVDVSPEALASAARVFPNPAVREVAYSVADARVVRVSLFDGLGRVVLLREEDVPAGEVGSLSLAGVPAGPYVLRLRLGDGRLVVRKLVVR